MAAAMVVFLAAIIGLLPWKFFWNPSQAGSTAGEITGSITNEAAMAAGSPQLIVPTVRIPEVPAAEPPRIPVVQPAENPGLSPPRQKKFPRAENYHEEEPGGTKLSMFLNEQEFPRVSEPRLRYRVNPVYTQEARDAKLQGTVELRCLVLADGSVEVEEITQSLGHGLDEAAIAAVSQYRFEPARRDGQPVPTYVTVRLSFSLR